MFYSKRFKRFKDIKHCLLDGGRADVDPLKRDPRDFALWKGYKAEDGDVFWDSSSII